MVNYWAIAISLIFSALFSGMEIAFVSSNKLRFEIDKKSNSLTSKIIDFFYHHSEQYISTMLVGNNIALVVYSIQMANLLTGIIQQYIIASDFIVMIIQTIIATIIVLFTGEFIPKFIFKSNPNLWLNIFSPFIYIIYIILYPITIFTTFLSKNILSQLHLYNPQHETHELSKVDLDYFINESIEGSDSQEEIEHDVRIFQNALDFSEVKLRDCAIPRTEITALPEDGTSLIDLRNTFTNTGYSKILIYRDTIDNIIGYFHSNDLFKNPEDWKKKIRPLPIVPETMAANKLMDIFMQDKKSIAVVVDEFGGTAGIVTLEDIIEEIFGEIEDEHDNREWIARQINDNEYMLSGRLEIDTANTKFDINLPESENYVTIAGYILHYYQKFPKLNDTIQIENYTFKIIQAHNNRIDLVKLTINKEN